MKPFPTLKYSLPGVILTIVLLVGLLARFLPLPDATDRLNRIPAYGDGFISREESLTDAERIVFGKAHVIRRRIFCKGGQNGKQTISVLMTIIDGTRDRHAVHDPVYCFRGGGWQTVGNDLVVTEPRGTMRLVHVQRETEQRQAFYFYSNGKQRYDQSLRYWIDATLRRITFGLSGEEPLLVIIETDPAAARSNGLTVQDVLPTMERIVKAL